MHLFLTSSPSGCPFEPGPSIPVLDGSNHFADNLRAVWPAAAPRALFLAAFPDGAADNDQMRDSLVRCFADAGFLLAGADVCDRRNAGQFSTLLEHSGFVVLCGGHVPTQNRFFASINAAAALRNYNGIVLGISAGTMNAADLVYVQPEQAGEAADPGFSRWLPGLGLTASNVLPHFQKTRDWTVDGLRLVEDIALPDSLKRPLYALPDGSYIYGENGREILYGEAWRLENGRIEKICENGGFLPLRGV